MTSQTNGNTLKSDTRRSRTGRRRKSRRSWTGYLVDKGAKLLIWYSLITVLFRCPSTPAGITNDSPAVCNKYFQAKDLVLPYAKPYYDQYAAPYVQRVQRAL